VGWNPRVELVGVEWSYNLQRPNAKPHRLIC
jgi:hypothetical protein